jgi:hypothetical protein
MIDRGVRLRVMFFAGPGVCVRVASPEAACPAHVLVAVIVGVPTAVEPVSVAV